MEKGMLLIGLIVYLAAIFFAFQKTGFIEMAEFLSYLAWCGIKFVGKFAQVSLA